MAYGRTGGFYHRRYTFEPISKGAPPEGCLATIINGGFEDGILPWVCVKQGTGSIVSCSRLGDGHSGSYYGRTSIAGEVGNNGDFAQWEQSIDHEAICCQLDFWYKYIVNLDDLPYFDVMCILMSPNGAEVYNLSRTSIWREITKQWPQRLTGSPVKIILKNRLNLKGKAEGASWVYLDDVTFTTIDPCPSPPDIIFHDGGENNSEGESVTEGGWTILDASSGASAVYSADGKFAGNMGFKFIFEETWSGIEIERSFDETTKILTFSFWVNDLLSDESVYISIDDATSSNWVIWWYMSYEWDDWWYGEIGGDIDEEVCWETRTLGWHQVKITVDEAGKVRFYVDGDLKGTSDANIDIEFAKIWGSIETVSVRSNVYLDDFYVSKQ